MQTDCLGKVSQILYFNVEWDTVFMALPPNGFSDGIMLRPVTLWTTVKYKLWHCFNVLLFRSGTLTSEFARMHQNCESRSS